MVSVDVPLLRAKRYDEASEFTAENLLRDARRQKHLPRATVPAICVLDPDGDILRYLRSKGSATKDEAWACYHTDLYRFEYSGQDFGIVGCAVGASYAVLVAEQMFASGCELLVSFTSSGQITPLGSPPYFILIEKALRDEGTSYHYLPPSNYAEADERLIETLWPELSAASERVERGGTWTTDAPFRETSAAIEAARSMGLLAVEMEASALYAFAQSTRHPVICFAHVTNQMGRAEGDFEKGEENGAPAAIKLIGAVWRAWQNRDRAPPA